jgi:hypothetical protein
VVCWIKVGGRGAERVRELTECYCDEGEDNALDEALHLAERLDPSVITDPVRRATALRWIGLARQYDYERGGGLDSLERSVRALRQAVEAILEGDGRGTYLSSLCNALRQLDGSTKILAPARRRSRWDGWPSPRPSGPSTTRQRPTTCPKPSPRPGDPRLELFATTTAE